MDTLKDTLEADKVAYQTALKDLFKDFEQDDELDNKTVSSKKDDSEEDNISKSSTPSIKTKIYKVGDLYATMNDKGKAVLYKKLVIKVDNDELDELEKELSSIPKAKDK